MLNEQEIEFLKIINSASSYYDISFRPNTNDEEIFERLYVDGYINMIDYEEPEGIYLWITDKGMEYLNEL